MSEAFRAVVLGAGGTIAPAIVRDLAESREVSSLLLLDLDAQRAAVTAKLHGQGKATARSANANAGLAEAIADADVLVNAASYRINRRAMEAAIEARCHYIDLGGLYWETKRQLELSPQFERIGKLALLGMGSSPGKTNVMALAAVRALGTTPTSVTVSAAGRDLDPPTGGLSIPYALRTLIDELTLRPVVVRDGTPVEIDPLTAAGEVDFGEPVGTGETIFTLHSEVLTFPDSFGCSDSSFRLFLRPELLERLRGLTSASDDEIATAARKALPPSSNTVSVHAVEASSDGRAVRLRARTEPSERWGLGGGLISTGAPAAAAVRMLARGTLSARGALLPERCVNPDELFAELEQRGCAFTVEKQEAVGA